MTGEGAEAANVEACGDSCSRQTGNDSGPWAAGRGTPEFENDQGTGPKDQMEGGQQVRSDPSAQGHLWGEEMVPEN